MRVDAPAGSVALSRFQGDQSFPGVEGIWRAGHGLDSQARAPPVRLGQSVPGKDFQIGVALIGPKGHGISECPRAPVHLRVSG